MKNQIIIALAFLMSILSFAQKKELRAVEKAIKNTWHVSFIQALFSMLSEELPLKFHKGAAQKHYSG